MDLKQITDEELIELDYHIQPNYNVWCCYKKCCSQYGGRFFGEPLFLIYGKEFNINLLYCKQCWLHNFRKIKYIYSLTNSDSDSEVDAEAEAEEESEVDAEVEVVDAEVEVEVDAEIKAVAVEVDIKAEAEPDELVNSKTILSLTDARELYSNIEKDCFVINCDGNVQARCLWCKKYTDGLSVYQTYLDNNFYVIVAGHEYNCSI